MDLIMGYRGSGSSSECSDDESSKKSCDQKPSSIAASVVKEPEKNLDYRTSSPSTSDDEPEFAEDCVVLSDGGDSEAEFNQILELCRKQRERESEQKRTHRPSVNLDKVFNSEYNNLPPVNDLQIHIEEDITLKPFGVVESFLGFIVSIKPHTGVPHLDFDTMLFDEHRNAIGEVFEIYGKVQDTMYAIRFNSAEDAKKLLSIGTPIFYAPQEDLITHTVLSQELMKVKISDSAHDADDSNEEEKTFSDDESEAAYLAKKRAKARPAPRSTFAGFSRAHCNKRPRQMSRPMMNFPPVQMHTMNFFNNPYM